MDELVQLIINIMGKNNVTIDYIPSRPGDVNQHLADIEKSKKVINIETTIDFEEGLKETISWYLSNTKKSHR